jgi:hypothetical protein
MKGSTPQKNDAGRFARERASDSRSANEPRRQSPSVIFCSRSRRDNQHDGVGVADGQDVSTCCSVTINAGGRYREERVWVPNTGNFGAVVFEVKLTQGTS